MLFVRVDDLHGIAALADAVTDPAVASKRSASAPCRCLTSPSVLRTLISVVPPVQLQCAASDCLERIHVQFALLCLAPSPTPPLPPIIADAVWNPAAAHKALSSGPVRLHALTVSKLSLPCPVRDPCLT